MRYEALFESFSERVSADGSMIGGTCIEWKSYSHFYKKGVIIVHYISGSIS